MAGHSLLMEAKRVTQGRILVAKTWQQQAGSSRHDVGALARALFLIHKQGTKRKLRMVKKASFNTAISSKLPKENPVSLRSKGLDD